jgi:uncharacterized membrane protein YidH (DUF202 family)
VSRWAHDPERGLAGERTDLAWHRTGLAMIIILGGIGRNALKYDGPLAIAAVVCVLVGTAIWWFGLQAAHRLSATTHTGRHRAESRLLGVVTAGTLVIALAALLISI